MATNKIMELLSMTDRGANEPSGPNGILAKLFRTILRQLNITPPRFSKCMTDYIHDPNNGIPDTRAAHTQERGNIMKQLGNSEMTFKVFLKGLRLIKIVRVEFIVKAYHPNGTYTMHSTDIDEGMVISRHDDEDSKDKESEGKEHDEK